MAEHAKKEEPPTAGAQKQTPPEEEQQDALEFATKVRDWVSKADQELADLQEELGAPTLAIDSHILSQLNRLRRSLDEVRGDLGTQLPAPDAG